MKEKSIKIVLSVCALALTILCIASVYRPMHFDEEQAEREQAVKERLLSIRKAEESYRSTHGAYSGDFQTLISQGLLADSMQYIPFSEHERFDLQATVVTSKTGRQIPLMECGAQYQQYLSGLDDNSIANLLEKANASGSYPGLRIGDITQANNNAGNWE